MKTERQHFIYESPEIRVIEILNEGVLCASGEDSLESYRGIDDFEELF